ncbi:MAG: hypothetical protein JO262_07485 [Solirubrobacterales bacterium]|nr:hypothetical protein [Solirubrobacterales bacterium]
MRVLPAVVVVALGVAFALPSVAQAQSTTPLSPVQTTSPLSPGFPQPSVSTPTATAVTPTITSASTPTAGSGSGFSGSSALFIAIGALVVLGGISLFIWRDARRRAPVRHRTGIPADAQSRRQGSKQRAKPRKLSPAERRRRKRGRAR